MQDARDLTQLAITWKLANSRSHRRGTRDFVKRARARDVALAPPDKREQNAAQFSALCGELVGVTHRMLLVGGARDDSGLLEALQPLGQDVGRDALGRGAKLAVRPLAVEDVANDEQRPLVANDIECAPRPGKETSGFSSASLWRAFGVPARADPVTCIMQVIVVACNSLAYCK